MQEKSKNNFIFILYKMVGIIKIMFIFVETIKTKHNEQNNN